MNKITKICGLAGAAAVCAAAGALFLTAPGKASPEQKAPFAGRNFAHRGLHRKTDNIPENSLAAFRAAAENGYGVELDVHLTADNRVVVFHDDTTERMCGTEGTVSQMTWSQLRTLRLDGTKECIPLLSEVLAVMDSRGPIIVELKRGPDNTELCRRTLELLQCYSGPVCVESFDPMILRWFRKNAPELLRGQLTASPASMKEGTTAPAAFAVGNVLTNFLCRPQFIAHKLEKKTCLVRLSEKLGAMRVAWTATQDSAEDANDAVIFEGYRPRQRYR